MILSGIKTCSRYLLLAMLCVSFVTTCPEGLSGCVGTHSHDHSGHAHHALDNHHAHGLSIGTSHQCCSAPTGCGADCIQVFTFPVKAASGQSIVTCAATPHVSIIYSDFSGEMLSLQPRSCADPTIVSLRTIVLLT